MLINNKERKRTVSRNVKLFGGENRMTPLRKQHVPSDAKGKVKHLNSCANKFLIHHVDMGKSRTEPMRKHHVIPKDN